MIEQPERAVLFMRDFTGKDRARFFWKCGEDLLETNPQELVSFGGRLVCHDFWAVRDIIFDITGSLPAEIIDIDEMRISISGNPDDRLDREKLDITHLLADAQVSSEICGSYRQMFYYGKEFETAVGLVVANALQEIYRSLFALAIENDEAGRFYLIEVPVFRIIQLAMARGIRLDTKTLSKLRGEAEFEYFLRLKEYSHKHDMPLETPSFTDLAEKIQSLGFDLTGVSTDYILEYIPHASGFGEETIALLEADTARNVLASLTLSLERARPIADVFGSRTSRIQLRNPSLQSISKRCRSIIIPDDGFQLSYVDYDQYEVGIMAALSGDHELCGLYGSGDMYKLFAEEHLGLQGGRKVAKQLFLSYAYGMSRKALIDAAVSLGASRERAKDAFRRFVTYESWKKTVTESFERDGAIRTDFGNHYVRKVTGPLSPQEARSSVSQVVQGTASLIFKKTILEVANIDDAQILLPMHDALLFSHSCSDTPSQVVKAFEKVMTEHLGARVKGKASVGTFAFN